MNGTYTIVVDPVGRATLTLYDVPPDLASTLTSGVNSLPQVFTTPGQNGVFSFPSTAGQKVALRVNSSTLSQTYLSILKADYSSLGYFNHPSSAYLEAVTLPVTGSYFVYHNPVSSETRHVNVTLYVFFFNDVTGTVTVNAPVPTYSGLHMDATFFPGNATVSVAFSAGGMPALPGRTQVKIAIRTASH